MSVLLARIAPEGRPGTFRRRPLTIPPDCSRHPMMTGDDVRELQELLTQNMYGTFFQDEIDGERDIGDGVIFVHVGK
jgi:hypothetical protein